MQSEIQSKFDTEAGGEDERGGISVRGGDRPCSRRQQEVKHRPVFKRALTAHLTHKTNPRQTVGLNVNSKTKFQGENILMGPGVDKDVK